MSMWELLRDAMPSVSVTQQSMGFISCVEYRGAVNMRGQCQQMSIFIDGVYVSSPGTVPPNMPLNDVERIEAIGPGQAGVQYGSLGGAGVLLIETRTGAEARATRRINELPTGMDWSGETQPYAWTRTLGSSFLANAVGLGLGWLVAGQCLSVEDQGSIGVRERCGALPSIVTGAVAVALPNAAGSYAAQWSGQTDRTRGRFLPAAILGALPSITGYLLYFEGHGKDSAFMKGAGLGLLTVGTPVLMTLSDRLFRVLR
jgi:hypothetical protein